jgi:hypothetical protein
MHYIGSWKAKVKMKRLSNEQAAVVEKLANDFFNATDDLYDEEYFEAGFQAAQDPAMLLLNPLVKGLVEAIRASGRQCDYHGMGIDFTKCTCAGCLKHKALAPFKGSE